MNIVGPIFSCWTESAAALAKTFWGGDVGDVSNFLSIIQCYTGSDLFELVQTCANFIKLVQISSNMSKLDQTCPDWIKLVQIG